MLVTALALHYWLGRMACPGSAVLRKAFAHNSIGADLGAIASIGDAWNLVLTGFIGYIESVGACAHACTCVHGCVCARDGKL